MSEIRLPGCAPTPLAYYLKALAILRLVAEQRDGAAMGHWEGECFVLTTTLDESGLGAFFLQDYQPTPIISPWNGRAGFLEGEDADASTRKGAVILRRLVDSKAGRFAPYRRVIAETRTNPLLTTLNSTRTEIKTLNKRKKAGELIEDARIKVLAKHEKALKSALLSELRGRLPEDFVRWMDACLITAEKPIPAPLLGTGGNEGSMDFSVNHLILLAEMFDLDDGAPTTTAVEAVGNSLFAANGPVLQNLNPGLLSPNAVGGANMGAGFSGSLVENAWNAVLMLEGTLIFAVAAARRLDTESNPVLSFPFTVGEVLSGQGGMSDQEKSRPELWVPLWKRPMTLVEVRALLREGRATLGRRRARNALDMTRAIAGLGVDRGVSAFQRYGFFERRGQGYFIATPLNRVQVRRNPEADLIADLDRGGFLDRLRRKLREENTPARLRALGHRLDGALMALAERGGRGRVQAVLVLLGALAPHLARLTERDKVHLPPLPRLDAAWVLKADDGTVEFRLAVALASLDATDGWQWASEKLLHVWTEGRLTQNIVRAIERRMLDARRAGLDEKPFGFRLGAEGQEVNAWLAGRVDEGRLGDLLAGLALARMPDGLPRLVEARDAGLPAGYAVLKPFFTPDRLLRHLGFLPPESRLPLTDDLIALLHAERLEDAVENAWRRLRAAGVALPRSPARPPMPVPQVSGERLLAVLAVPMDVGPLAAVLRKLTPAHDSEPLTV